MRLIDAGEAKVSLDWTLIGDAADAACRVIDNVPTVDAVVVTRCKNCKYAYINSFAVSSGEALCTLSGKPMQQDDFCSCGEPKEGNQA